MNYLQLLIPTVDVLKVSKEKTARIIPNAVGISTEDEKHVFGSLLSRDSAYKLMVQVWKAANSPDPAVEIVPPKVRLMEQQACLPRLDRHDRISPVDLFQIIKNDIEDSASGEVLLDDDSSASGSGNEDPSVPGTPLPSVTAAESGCHFCHLRLVRHASALTACLGFAAFQKLVPKVKKSSLLTIPLAPKTSSKEYWSLAKPSTILAISTALLVSLFLSAGFLLYRIARIQNHFHDFPLMSNR